MIYFITAGNNQYIKIGYAADPAERIKQLQTGNAERLKLIAATMGSKDDERRLHEKWHYAQRQGEWFSTMEDIRWFATRYGMTLPHTRNDGAKLYNYFVELSEQEPDLRRLWFDIASVVDYQERAWFCANDVWYGDNGYSGFKPRLEKLVGWYSRSAHPAIRSRDVWERSYRFLYGMLPNCRRCSCISGGK